MSIEWMCVKLFPISSSGVPWWWKLWADRCGAHRQSVCYPARQRGHWWDHFPGLLKLKCLFDSCGLDSYPIKAVLRCYFLFFVIVGLMQHCVCLHENAICPTLRIQFWSVDKAVHVGYLGENERLSLSIWMCHTCLATKKVLVLGAVSGCAMCVTRDNFWFVV